MHYCTRQKHFCKTFSIFYMLNSKTRLFKPYFLNTFVDNLRVKPTILFMEKILFHFYGQSFVKTVRGPLAGYHSISQLLSLSLKTINLLI